MSAHFAVSSGRHCNKPRRSRSPNAYGKSTKDLNSRILRGLADFTSTSRSSWFLFMTDDIDRRTFSQRIGMAAAAGALHGF
jgi:hypothetical protein